MGLDKKVTVLMPVYNAEKYLREAIESVLNQTYRDFELLIINDGSTDGSEQIIKGFKDDRVIYVENERNMGIVKTLNRGLELIQGEYVLRMDSDDICLPERIERQVQFMDGHPDIAVAGTAIQLFDEAGMKKVLRPIGNPEEIRIQLLFRNVLMHPTVIMRTSVLSGGGYRYDERHQALEDYGLWQKISFDHALGNVPEVLLKYRINDAGITQSAEKDTRKRDCAHMMIYAQGFDHLGMENSQEDLEKYRYFVTDRSFKDEKEMIEIARILQGMRQALKKNHYELEGFDRMVCRCFKSNCVQRRKTVLQSVDIYRRYFKGIFEYKPMDLVSYAKGRCFS